MNIRSSFLLANLLIPAVACASPQFGGGQARAQKALAAAQEKFEQADVNHDGKLTLDEAKAGMPRVAQNFSKIDTSGQGYVTLDQIQAFVKAQAGG